MIETTNFFYADTLKSFLRKNFSKNDFVNYMSEQAFENGINAGSSEERSWGENFDALRVLLSNSGLPDDVVIAFEYLIPVGGRIDCMLFGYDENNIRNAIHIELKQWSNNSVNVSFAGRAATTVMVGGHYYTHPCAQAESYQVHLNNYIRVLNDGDFNLMGFVYCYNYSKSSSNNHLYDEVYNPILNRCPLFCKDTQNGLIESLKKLLSGGKGTCIFKDFTNSEICPTAKLQDSAKSFLEGENAKKEFELIGDQLDAYNFIFDAVRNTPKNEKTVVIVKGGPGTGKSVIAMQLIAGLAKTGSFNNVFYSTRSTSLIHGYQEILKGVNYKDGNDNAALDLFKKNVHIKPAIYGENGIDALLVDEAHRIEQSSNDSNDKNPQNQTHLSQIMNMIFCSRVSVFFIDDFQSVKSIEIGKSIEIEKAAKNYYNRIIDENRCFIQVGLPKKLSDAKKDLEKIQNTGEESEIAKKKKVVKKFEEYAPNWPDITKPTIKDVNVVVYDLKDQFRCNGSNNYLDWIEHVLLNTKRTQNVKLDLQKYEFGVFDTPQELYEKIRSLDDFALYSDKRAKELGSNFSYKELSRETAGMEFKQTARLVAGWCWPWKQNEREENGDLLHEIKIPEHNFEMPWETLKGGNGAAGDFRYKYARNQDLWLIDKEGVNQIGCNHSSQGWETDYIGVIIAKDIKYDEHSDCLCTDYKIKNYDSKVSNSKNKADVFDQITKNIYRVLLTRGKKGCFIFCCDPKVGEYFKRCMNQ